MAIYGDDDMIFPIDDKNQEVYNAISSLKNQNYAETTEEADDFLKKHTLHRNDRSKKDLNPYYCAICGINVLLMNSKLEKMPSRVTDGAIIVDTSKLFIKHYLTSTGQPIVVQRDGGKDIIVEYRCKCQTPVGYISLNGLPNVRDAVLNINIKGMSDAEKIIFIFNDSLVLDAKNALVFSELSQTKLD